MGRLLDQKEVAACLLHAPPPGRTWKQWDLTHHHLQKKKTQAVDFIWVFFRSVWSIMFSPPGLFYFLPMSDRAVGVAMALALLLCAWPLKLLLRWERLRVCVDGRLWDQKLEMAGLGLFWGWGGRKALAGERGKWNRREKAGIREKGVLVLWSGVCGGKWLRWRNGGARWWLTWEKKMGERVATFLFFKRGGAAAKEENRV